MVDDLRLRRCKHILCMVVPDDEATTEPRLAEEEERFAVVRPRDPSPVYSS
jgi:hypothetical protein